MKNIERVLELLACPYCKQELSYDSTKGTLSCSTCIKTFPIIDNIPRFVEVNDGLLEKAKEHWEDSPNFQYEAKADLYTKEYYEDQDKWRFEDVDPFSVDEYKFDTIKGKVTLDIGCGSGWVVKQSARHGAFSIGLDFTERAVISTKRALDSYNLDGLVIQADAQYLPIKTGVIDHVYSIGVLHHIPVTEFGVAEAYRVVKSGGTGFISLYGKLFFFNPVLFPIATFFLRLLLNAPKVRDGIQYTINYDEFYRHMDGSTNPIGRWYTEQQLRKLMSGFKILSITKSHFPLRYLYLFGIPIKKLIPKPVHRLLERYFGMMRNMQLVKE